MRELDRNTLYFDRYGDPLKGRVSFFQKGTTTKQAIYNSDGTELANPIFTTSGKLSPQVFLGDADYSIVWEQYIGNDTMSTDDDSDNWVSAGSCISLQPVISFEVENYGIVNVENIEALRAIDTTQFSDGDIITLLGYDAAGDKPSVNYIWDADSTATDNSGDVIKATGTTKGRFIIIQDRMMDVRHWGVFPAATLDELDSTQKMRLVTAHAYAAQYDIDLYLPNCEGSTGYYLLSSVTYNHLKAQDYYVRFVMESGTVASLKAFDGYEVRVYHDDTWCGKCTIYGDNLKASYSVSQSTDVSFVPSKSFLVDVATQTGCPDTFTEISVEFKVESSKGYTFKDCSITSNGKLVSSYTYSFENCVFTDRYFVDKSPMFSTITLTDCTVNVEDFYTAENWYYAGILNGSTDFDFKGRDVGEIELSANGDITGAHFTEIVSMTQGVTDIKFTRCSFAARVYSADKMEFQDCEVYNIGSGYEDVVPNCTVMNCSVSQSVYANSLTASNSVFNNTVNLYALSGTQNLQLNGNTFASSFIQYVLVSGCTLAGYVINNYFNVKPGITRKYDSSAAAYIDYTDASVLVFNGNSGKAPKNDITTTDYSSMTATSEESSWTGYACIPYDVELFGFGSKKVLVHMTASQQSTDGTHSGTGIDIFRIVTVSMTGFYTMNLGQFDLVTGNHDSVPAVLLEVKEV